jgi:hypothetical protein
MRPARPAVPASADSGAATHAVPGSPPAPEEPCCLNSKSDLRPEIYRALVNHQTTSDEAEFPIGGNWQYRNLSRWLRSWTAHFIDAFGLEITPPTVSVDRLRASTLGRFRKVDGYGLHNTVEINAMQLEEEPAYLLVTLVIELLHFWQERHGGGASKNGYHNATFRTKARSLGLVLDERGRLRQTPGDHFAVLLRAQGIDIPDNLGEPQERRGSSKLKLWKCPCGVRLRFGAGELHAMCKLCGQDFERASPRNYRARRVAAGS